MAGVVVFALWRELWFLTDDAYILFRYVGNSRLGHGYVWNPPPFLPVEGYTSFLWVVLLDGVWRATGVEPPDAANWLSLGFSLASVALVSWAVARVRLTEDLRPMRAVVLALVLAGVVTQRTWATWTSSGLCTAMCNFWILAWFLAAWRWADRRTRGWGALVSALATLVALTRPEGLLLATATMTMIGVAWIRSPRAPGSARDALLALAPMAGIAAHLIWRRGFYGEWLPNTYYAKHVGVWPEAGVRYFWSYVLEYGLWFWALVAVGLGLRLVRRDGRGLVSATNALRLCALAAIAGNFLYYTLDVGGGTFEFRIYSHLVPLMALALLWLCDRAGLRPATVLPILALHAVLGWPIAWLHYRLALDVPAEEATSENVVVPVAPSLPKFLRWYGESFDASQEWLLERLVCGRHHNHRHFTELLLRSYPRREHGLAMERDELPVIALEAVGVAAWTLPHVAVIDRHGLNDYVVARWPAVAPAVRQMAHDRIAPAEYVADFEPNVVIVGEPPNVRARVRKRRTGPLTDQKIVEREAHWRSRL